MYFDQDCFLEFNKDCSYSTIIDEADSCCYSIPEEPKKPPYKFIEKPKSVTCTTYVEPKPTEFNCEPFNNCKTLIFESKDVLVGISSILILILILLLFIMCFFLLGTSCRSCNLSKFRMKIG